MISYIMRMIDSPDRELDRTIAKHGCLYDVKMKGISPIHLTPEQMEKAIKDYVKCNPGNIL